MAVFSEKKRRKKEELVSDGDTFSNHSVIYQLIHVTFSFGRCHLLLERGRGFFLHTSTASHSLEREREWIPTLLHIFLITLVLHQLLIDAQYFPILCYIVCIFLP